MLEYATPLRKRQGHDLDIARDIASRFATWNMIFACLAAATVGVSVSMGAFGAWVDAFYLFCGGFLATVASYSIMIVVCLMHLRFSKKVLVPRESIWPYAAIYSLLVEGLILFIVAVGGDNGFSESLCVGWTIFAPMAASLLLLQKRDAAI